jgi:hypothetical protein
MSLSGAPYSRGIATEISNCSLIRFLNHLNNLTVDAESIRLMNVDWWKPQCRVGSQSYLAVLSIPMKTLDISHAINN